MKKIIKTLILTAAVLSLPSMPAMAQKKITPVDNDPTKPRQPVLHYYDKHGNPLDEPVLFLADLDTVTKAKSGPVYPLLHSASVGFNFFDGVMLLAGQKHASFDLWASLSLHNWFEPVVEMGIGFADNRPEDGNFHYKGKPSFYGKIGINYNFLYKSDPDYQVYLGLRGGFTSFRYDITDIDINSSYWDQTNRFSITGQRAHAVYGEVLGGIKVKLWKNISMGWSARYKIKGKVSNGSNSTPWFIPGYGTTPLSATFSLIYTIPINAKKKEPVIQDPDKDSLPVRDPAPDGASEKSAESSMSNKENDVPGSRF